MAGGNELAEAVILVCRPFQGFRHFQGHEHRIDVGIARQRLMANGRYAPLNDKGGALRHLGQIKLPIKELPAGGRRCEHTARERLTRSFSPHRGSVRVLRSDTVEQIMYYGTRRRTDTCCLPDQANNGSGKGFARVYV